MNKLFVIILHHLVLISLSVQAFGPMMNPEIEFKYYFLNFAFHFFGLLLLVFMGDNERNHSNYYRYSFKATNLALGLAVIVALTFRLVDTSAAEVWFGSFLALAIFSSVLTDPPHEPEAAKN